MNSPEPFNNRILIIDDNTSIHDDFRKIFHTSRNDNSGLLEAGQLLFGAPQPKSFEPTYEISSAYQGVEGLEMIRRAAAENKPFALAFVDVRMPPGIDGIETIKAIWKECPDLQIAICTAYSDYSWQDMIKSVGSLDNMLILKKPFDNIEVRQIACAMTAKWNVTRAREKERAALELLKRQYEMILNSVGEGIHHIDRDGRINYENPAAARMFGWSADEMVGLPAHYTIHHSKQGGAAYPQSECPIFNTLKDGKTRHVTDEVFWRKDGTSFPVEYTSTAIIDRTGVPTGATVVFKDITERQLAEAEMLRLNAELQDKNKRLAEDIVRREQSEIELIKARRIAEEANMAKSTFLANMSHEIRTPMNGIVGMIYLMKQTALTLKQSDYAAKIDFAAKGLLGIINDILDFSKIEAGKIKFERIEFNLDEVMARLLQLNSLQAQKKSLDFKLSVASDTPRMLVGDPMRLGQVLLNLVSNAIKFTERGDVAVSVQRINRENPRGITLRFEVRDTGIGIPPDQIGRLFEPFVQSDSATSRRYGGTGLGLAISKRFVQIMNGEIGVRSTLGQGSTFYFTASFERGKDSRASQSSIRLLPVGRRVLVVNRDPVALQETCRLLTELSYEAIGVDSCASAARKLAELSQSQTRTCDLAIMDCSSSDMDWTESAKNLRRECGPIAIPPVILIASPELGDQHVRVRDAGFESVLIKPVTRSSLFDAIMNASSKSGSRAREAADPQVASSLRGSRVLLVEDNEINQEVAAEILRLAGCEVSVADDGTHALAVLRAAVATGTGFDAVLMDLQMPGMDGYETTRAIRADPAHARLPIIAMTADAITGIREKCIESGMNDYLTKPINPDEVYSTLAKWIDANK